MSGKPNRLGRFWQELKRRKVIYVVTVYASAAFIIIELVNNVLEPLNLPENLSTIVIISLAIGFPIVLILSWIFDVTPKGIEKTEPVDEETAGKKVVTSNAWRIATYASVVIIAGLVIFNIFTRNQFSDSLILYGKSIAVLPFKNDSPDQENDYFINGTMESILGNLSKIKDLRVISRTSVEQYRNTFKPIPEIAKEMKASYFLEASMRKYGSQIRMTVQLTDQTDTRLWSGEYERTIQQVEDLFSLESEIAQLVAEEVHAIITPEEKQLIEKVPTTSLTANEFFSKGKEELNKYLYQNDKDAIDRAESLFRKALAYDSTYALAYTGLGRVYFINDTYTEKILSETFMDSVLYYVNRALSFDNQLAEAYRLRGEYAMEVSRQGNKALSDYNRALELNPNDFETYVARGQLNIDFLGDYVRGLEDLEQALKRSSGSEMIGRISHMGGVYREIGLYDIAHVYYLNFLSLTGDSVGYFNRLLRDAYNQQDIETMLKLEKKIQKFQPDYRIWGWIALDIGLEEVVKEYINRDETGLNEDVIALYAYSTGYSAWLNGDYEKAEYYFNLQIKYGEEIIKKNRAHGIYHSHIDMIKVFAFTNNHEKALEYLDDLAENTNTLPSWMISSIKLCPMIEPIRGEPRYKEIMQKIETKQEAERNRVRRWLEETGRMEEFSSQ